MKRIIILFVALSAISNFQVSADENHTDRLLRNKWNLLTSSLRQGNEEKALELIYPTERENYAIMFQALRNQMPQIISREIDFKLTQIGDYRAEYELITKEDAVTYSYEVIFLKDHEGTWYIYEF